MKYILIITVFISSIFVHSQSAMDDWSMLISPYSSVGVVYANGSVFNLLEKGILEYDVRTGEKTVWTAANYLSDVSPTAASYHKSSKNLIIGYDNGNVDFIRNNRVYNFPYIHKTSSSGVKRINKVRIHGDYAYLATGLGIVVIDVKRKEVKDTYHPVIGAVEFIDVEVFDSHVYALTKDAVYKGSVENSFLADPSQWTKLEFIEDYTDDGYYSFLESFQDELYLSYRNELYFNADTLYQIKENELAVFKHDMQVNGMNSSNSRLLVSHFDNVMVYDQELNEIEKIYQYGEAGNWMRPKNTIYAEDDYYIADLEKGLVKAKNSYNYSFIKFAGPRYDKGYRAEWLDGKLSIASGGFIGMTPSFSRDGGMILEDGEWTSVTVHSQEMLDNTDVWDFISTTIHPKEKNIVVYGSNSSIPIMITTDGVITDTFTVYNSLLERVSPNMDWSNISDIDYDNEGNLWVGNSNADRPLKVYTKEGEWFDFDIGNAVKGKTVKRVLVDKNGVKWISFRGEGIIAFDSGENIGDASDDRYVRFTTGEASGALPSNEVEAIASDFDNNIWIGTPEGMRVLYNSSTIFDADPGKYNFQKLIIEFGEHNEIVLGTTHITSIEIDGGNRKWIGTASGGVFLLSPDGLEVERNFTAENSPLLSNSIYDIAIDHTTGEVYFITEAGVISYRSDASQGDAEYSDVKVFPNPAYPARQGPITIQGIAYDSDVKITDASGKVVYQTKSHGGTATWDGNTLDGKRASTGVYLIWTSIDDHDFKGRKVGKVLLIE